MKIKRLSLESWMTLVNSYPWNSIASGLEETKVVFNKDGWYLRDNYSWWEYKGKAYTSKELSNTFTWCLKHMLAQNFTEEQVKKLYTVCKFLKNPLKRKLEEELRLWNHNQEIKKITKSGKLFWLKNKKHRKKK